MTTICTLAMDHSPVSLGLNILGHKPILQASVLRRGHQKVKRATRVPLRGERLIALAVPVVVGVLVALM
jgi:hypothetical protein